MWKAILLASGLILASAASQAAMPMQNAAPATAIFTGRAPGADTVQYRHDRGNHYGWYKQRRHKGWYAPHRPYRQYYRPPHRRYW